MLCLSPIYRYLFEVTDVECKSRSLDLEETAARDHLLFFLVVGWLARKCAMIPFGRVSPLKKAASPTRFDEIFRNGLRWMKRSRVHFSMSSSGYISSILNAKQAKENCDADLDKSDL